MQQRQLIIRQIGIQPYSDVMDAMRAFTYQRTQQTLDEIWLAEHPAVYTQGKIGKPEHLLSQTTIPVIQSDRGGQITYHGPGQQIMYVLIDLHRKKINVRQLVSGLEQSVINTLQYFNITAYARKEAPGVYVEQEKICSLGLRIHKGCSFHGLALNINMDLRPFESINPCGYAGLAMTQIQHFIPNITVEHVQPILINQFNQLLNYIDLQYTQLEFNHWSTTDYD